MLKTIKFSVVVMLVAKKSKYSPCLPLYLLFARIVNLNTYLMNRKYNIAARPTKILVDLERQFNRGGGGGGGG